MDDVTLNAMTARVSDRPKWPANGVRGADPSAFARDILGCKAAARQAIPYRTRTLLGL